MTEWKLFDGQAPEFTTAAWHTGRQRAPHLEEAGHRGRLCAAARMAGDLIRAHDEVSSVVDLGCGDGGLLSLLEPQWPDVRFWGYDASQANVDAAVHERGVDARLGDFVNDATICWGDVAIMTEVLEHLADPHGWLREVARHCPFVVCSSPTYETAQHHYEFHAWAWDDAGYHALLRQAGYQAVQGCQVDGFQVLAARRPR